MKILQGPFFWAMIFLAMLPLILTAGPAIETHYFPVFKNFRLVSMEETEPGRTRVAVSFEKVRNCEPAGYAWFRGARRGREFSEIEVRSVTMGNSVGRPLGQQVSAPFEVMASPDELNDIFVNVFSRCPFQPWITKTEAYP